MGWVWHRPVCLGHRKNWTGQTINKCVSGNHGKKRVVRMNIYFFPIKMQLEIRKNLNYKKT